MLDGGWRTVVSWKAAVDSGKTVVDMEDRTAVREQRSGVREQPSGSEVSEPLSVTNGPASEINGSLSEINGPLSEINRPLSVSDGPVSEINGSLSEINGPAPEINRPLSAINGPLSEIDGPTSEIYGPVSEGCGPLNEINGPMAEIDGPTSEIQGPVSEVSGSRPSSMDLWAVRPVSVQRIFPLFPLGRFARGVGVSPSGSRAIRVLSSNFRMCRCTSSQPVPNDERLYRRIPFGHNLVVRHEGKWRTGSQAFGDRDLKPSVDLASLCKTGMLAARSRGRDRCHRAIEVIDGTRLARSWCWRCA